MHYLDESHIFLFLVQVFILILLTRGLGAVFQKRKQPSLTAELLVGVFLGPTILGRFFPAIHDALFPSDVIQQNMLETVAWIGVFLMLLSSGLEIDFSIAWRQRGNAMIIAIIDIIIPMIVAFLPCILLPSHYLVDPDRRVIFALFMATVMTISALPVSARILHDLNLLKVEIGFLIMSALAVNDIVGWVLFTIILGIFMSAEIQMVPVFLIFILTVGFAALALTVGKTIFSRALNALQRRDLPEPATSLTFACLLGLLFGAITQRIGIHALFGFFIAGVVMGEMKNVSEDTRGIISQMVFAIFVPIFFANIGLKIDFIKNFDPLLVGLVCVIGIAGRYLGAWVGVTLSTAPHINRNLIAIAHTPGGMMEVVIALLALQSGLITPAVFVAIVFSAVFSSVIMGPWMRNAMNRRADVQLSDLLAPDSVIPFMKASDRTEAIRELSAAAAEKVGVDFQDRLIRDVLSREQEFGTGLGHGIAIPHARLEGVKNPAIVVGRAPHGLDWNAPDGEPVHSIFFLVTPSGAKDIHVQILAKIARVLQKAENRKRIDRAEDSAGLWQTLIDLFKDVPEKKDKTKKKNSS